MKVRTSFILTFILSLFVVHTGFAQSILWQCKTRCEQPELRQTQTPDCCRGTAEHELPTAMADMSPSDCPHAGNSNGNSDLASLLATSTCASAPVKSAAFAGIILPSLAQIPFISSRSFAAVAKVSLSPTTSPPLYHLNCSLLI